MKISFQKFAIFNGLLTVLLIAILMVVAYYRQGLYPFYFFPPIIVSLLSLLGYYLLSKAIKKEKNKDFIRFVIISTLIRLFFGILSNVTVILLWKSQSTIFVLSYFFSYFFLTFFEVYAIMYNLRADSKENN
jgi:hypothetical protein